MLDSGGTVVGRWRAGLRFPPAWVATILAIATWNRESSEPHYRDGLRHFWEVVVPPFEPLA